MIRNVLFFLIAIAIAYGVDWAPKYVALLSQNKISTFGQIQKYRKPCNRSPQGEMFCTDSYTIPKSLLFADKVRASGIGLGIFIAATDVYCENQNSRHLLFGDAHSPARTYELLKKYQTVQLDSINCESNLRVDVFNGRNMRRTGFIGSSMVIGDFNHVEQVKRVVEFFTAQIYFVLAIILAASILISRFFFRSAIKTSHEEIWFGVFSLAWLGFALVKSGLPEMIFPLISGNLVYVRLANYFGIVAYLGPGLYIVRDIKEIPLLFRNFSKWLFQSVWKNSKLNWFYFLVALICLSPWFAKGLGIVSAFAVPICLMAAYSRRYTSFLFFSVLTTIEVAKLFNVPYLPNGSTALLFVSQIIFYLFVLQIRHNAQINEILHEYRARDAGADDKRLLGMLKGFAKRFGVQQITLIEPNDGGTCRITIQWNDPTVGWSTEQFFNETLPFVFSHVLTTRSALWHVNEESDLAKSLRKGQPVQKNSVGSYFSVVPILRNGAPLGAIAMTAYKNELIDDEFWKEELFFATEMIMPLMSNQIWGRTLGKRDVWYQKCAATSKVLIESMEINDGHMDLHASINKIAKIISNQTGTSVFISRLDATTRAYDLRAASGFSEDVTRMYYETPFLALKENKQGPMPLAINTGKIVTVADTSWLWGVLHPMSKAILDKSECKSAAAVPVFYQHESDKEAEVWGLVWMESKETGFFTPSHEPGLSLLAGAVESIIKGFQVRASAKEALSGLVREDVADKLLRNEPVREEEIGYLLVADIRGSSRIANRNGSVVWSAFIDKIRLNIENIAGQYGLKLQLVVWDAFFFTKPCSEKNDAAFESFLECAKKINEFLYVKMKDAFPDEPIPIDGAWARFCVEFGDITRDIQNNTWTIAGSTMASINKLEQICKHIHGWFFITENNLPKRRGGFEVLNYLNPATGEKIERYVEKVSFRGDLTENGTKKVKAA